MTYRLTPEVIRAIAARAREVAHMNCRRCTGGAPGAVMLADATERYHSNKCDALTNQIASAMTDMAEFSLGYRPATAPAVPD